MPELLFWTLTVLVLGYAYIAAASAMNRYCDGRYHFHPISVATVMVATIPFAIVFAGFFLGNGGTSALQLAVGMTLFLFGGLAWYLTSKTSLAPGLASTALLAIAGLGMFVVLLAALMILGSSKRKKNEES